MNDRPDTTKIILLSDAAGGQNKNATILKFCTWFAKTYNVQVCQLFPPRGHSFGQCDRNFGIMKSGIKNKAIIETIVNNIQN